MKDYKERIFEHLDSFSFVNITEVQCAIEDFCYPEDWPQSASMWELLEYQELAEEYCNKRDLHFEEDNPITFPSHVRVVFEHDPDYMWWSQAIDTSKLMAEEAWLYHYKQFLESWKMKDIEDIRAEFENEDSGYPVCYTEFEYLDISKIDYQLFIQEFKVNPTGNKIASFW